MALARPTGHCPRPPTRRLLVPEQQMEAAFSMDKSLTRASYNPSLGPSFSANK